MQAFSFPVTPREYAIVFGAIPDCIIPLVKSGPKGCLDSLLFDNTNFFVDQRLLNTMSNKDIRSSINRSMLQSLPLPSRIKENIPIEWRDLWKLWFLFIVIQHLPHISGWKDKHFRWRIIHFLPPRLCLSENHHRHHSHHQRHSPDHNHLITEHRHCLHSSRALFQRTPPKPSLSGLQHSVFTYLILLPCVYLPLIPVFHSLCSYAPVLHRLKAPPLPPDLLDIEKDNYSQISPLKDSYSPPTRLDIVLFSFPSSSFNKPVDYRTYLCVLCLSADSVMIYMTLLFLLWVLGLSLLLITVVVLYCNIYHYIIRGAWTSLWKCHSTIQWQNINMYSIFVTLISV